jgi:deoxyribonucleoside regulator
MLARISELYYLHGLNQSEIAAEFGLSRIKVVRLLKEARERGVVRIEIVNPTDYCRNLSDSLKQAFGLHKAIVVPEGDHPGEVLMQALGKAAADHLSGVLKDGDRLGIGWGTMVRHVVDQLSKRKEVSVTCVPLLGSLGEMPPDFQVNDLVRRAAEKLGGQWRSLHVPFLVGSEGTRDAILSDPMISETISMWRGIDVALVGIGASLSHSPMLRSGYFGKADILQMEVQSVVGDICSRFFDATGKPCELDISRRMVGIDLTTLRTAGQVVAVATGLFKTEAIRAALRAGYVDVLVTGEHTAEALLIDRR